VYSTSPALAVALQKVCIRKPVLKQESLLVDVCDGDGDRYRFGFNGQEKVNEWAGIGNYLDFGERGYDSRTGRLGYSRDPLAAKYAWQSPYSFAGNSPVLLIDRNGEEIWIMDVEKRYGTLVERVQYKNGKLYDEGGKEVTTSNKYINEIKSILDNIQDVSVSTGDMINKLEQQRNYNHNIVNYDRDRTGDENFNRSLDGGSNGTSTRFNSNKVKDNSTPEATLAHELKHAFDRSLNQLNKTEVIDINGDIFYEAEWDAINVQNQILFNQGKELRKEYGGIKIPNDKYIAPKENDKPAPKEKEENQGQGSGMRLNIGDGKGGIKDVDSKTLK